MKLVADENIVGLDALPADVEVVAAAGRAIDRALLRDADALWVRSVTTVSDALVDGSRLCFVGTATAGLEHIDRAALTRRGIPFAAAPGANAMAVVEYVLAALLALREPWQRLEEGATLGVVGYGEVGRRLVAFAEAMGWPVRVSDPWLASRGGPRRFSSLDQVLACDVISLHCSLEEREPWPSRHLIGGAQLQALKAAQWLVNASRGAVIDNAALQRYFERPGAATFVLDVWEGEPAIDWRLLDAPALALATPHIAGYSWDAKWTATRSLWTAMTTTGLVAGQLGSLPAPAPLLPSAAPGGEDAATDYAAALLGACYDIRRDDAALRAVASRPPAERAQAFDALRRDYPLRRELLAVAGEAAAGDRDDRFLSALRQAAAWGTPGGVQRVWEG